LFLISFTHKPIYAENQLFQANINLAYNSKNFLDLQNDFRASDKGLAKLNINHDTNNSSSQLSINYNGNNKFTLDGSYLKFTKGIATIGVGKIDRNWSFSKNTSLILSNNARAPRSIFLTLKNKFGYDWLPSKANWSLEFFNGYTEGSLNNTKSMLFGGRAILSPIEGLDFELVQTSQWGGNGYSKSLSAMGTALLLDSNDSYHSSINKMAGFGISYLIPSTIVPLRAYGQVIGEDEAGNLPSCYGYLAGLEWTKSKIKYPTIIGIEVIDTRVDETTYGNCGPNTMYNNATYDYTNYGKTIGTSIGTEGTSFSLNLQSQISQKVNIELSTKSLVINDNNWSGHLLSSNRQSGLINSFGISWFKNNITLSGEIYHQDFNLNKASINSGYGVSFSSSMTF
jgi:hypothetical protein